MDGQRFGWATIWYDLYNTRRAHSHANSNDGEIKMCAQFFQTIVKFPEIPVFTQK
jgi:hypothetical protein